MAFFVKIKIINSLDDKTHSNTAPTHASDESSIVAHVGIPTLVSYVVATSIYAILLAALFLVLVLAFLASLLFLFDPLFLSLHFFKRFAQMLRKRRWHFLEKEQDPKGLSVCIICRGVILTKGV